MSKNTETRFKRSRKSGSKMDQGPTGAGKTKSSESHKGGNTGNKRVKVRKTNGDNLVPRVSTRNTPKHSDYGRDGHFHSKVTTRTDKFVAKRHV